MNFAIAFSAAGFAMASGQQSSQQNAGLSAQMMQSGWGKTILILVALGLVAVGGYHVYKGASKKFLKDLRVHGVTDHCSRLHRLCRQGRRARRRGCASRSSRRCKLTRRRRRASTPRSRRSARPVREGAPYRRRPWHRRLRRVQLCPQSLRPDVGLYRSSRLGQRLIQRRDLHRLDCRVAAALHVSQRRSDGT